MLKKVLGALVILASFVAPIVLKSQQNSAGGYLDVLTVQVKPAKIAEYVGLVEKLAQANRRFGGEHWIGMETAYGPIGRFLFVTPVSSYAEVAKNNAASQAAALKAFGKAGLEKWDAEVGNCIESGRSELRQRRRDLSVKVPDTAGQDALVGGSRFLRVLTLRVRPGHELDFAALAMQVKDAAEKNPAWRPDFISESLEGSRGTTFYVSTFRNSLADFDNNVAMPDLLGAQGYKDFVLSSGKIFESQETTIYRLDPSLSNPPADVAAVAPSFWNPKPPAPAKPKPAKR